MPQSGAQMYEQKQQLKHEHRDRLIAVGIRAIEHVLKPNDPEVIREYLDVARTHNAARIREILRAQKEYFPTAQPSRETFLLNAINGLFELAVTGKYVNAHTTTMMSYDANIIHRVFAPAYNSCVFESAKRQQNEINWQDRELRPLIEDSFEQLRTAEKQLKRKQRELKAA